MTLALHGKSRRRVACLIVLATMGALSAALLSVSPGRPAPVLAAPVPISASTSVPAGASGVADSSGPEITVTSGSTAEVVTLTFANPVPLGGTLTAASVVIRGDETNANVSTDIRRTSTITQLLTDADASWDANAGFESKSHSGPVLFDYLATRVDQLTWSLSIGVLCTSSCSNGSAIVIDAVTLLLDFTVPVPTTGTLTLRQFEWSPGAAAYLASDNADPSWLFDLSSGPTVLTGTAPGAGVQALPGAYTVTARSTAGWFHVSHSIHANAPSGFQCPAGPAPPGVSLPGGAAIAPVPITAGQSTIVCVHSAPLAALEVTKLHDLTGDGISADDEPLPGWRLAIYRDAAIVEAVTGDDGSHAFAGLVPGAYVVCEESRPGWEATYPPPGSRVADPAPSQGEPGRVCVTANLASGITGTVTFANRELVAEPGTLVIEKYCDLDASGTRDPVEPACGGALFDVYGPDGELAAGSVPSSADPARSLSLPANSYTVCEHPSPGTLNTDPGAAGAPDPAAGDRPCRLASLEAGQETTVRFGNYAIQPLVVVGEGAGSYAQSIAWSVSGQLTDGESPVVTVLSGGSHTFRFDIDVTRAVAYTATVATGVVTVTNPNPVASGLTALVHAPSVNLPGAIVDGCTAAGIPVTNFPATIPAGASLACNWSLASPDAGVAPSSLLVTPTLTSEPSSEVQPPQRVEPFAVGYLAAPPVGPPAVVVTDVLLAAGVEVGSLPLGQVDASRHFDGVPIAVRCADATHTELADQATGLQELHRANVARLSGLSGEAVAESAPVAITLRCQQPRLTLLKQLTGVPAVVGTVLPSAWTLRARTDDAAIDLAGASGVSAFVPAGAVLLLDESGGDARFQPGAIVCTGPSGEVVHSAPGPGTTFAMPAVDTICTFTNTYRPASLTVTLRALPAWSQPFAFSVGGPATFAFALDDDGDDANDRPRAWSKGDLAPGAYTVDASPDSAGVWRLVAPVACTRDGIPFDPAARPGGVDLELHPGDDVVCTFEFRATATIQLCKAILLRGEEVDGASLPGHRGPTTFTIPFDGATEPLAFAIGDGAPLDPPCTSPEVDAGVAYHYGPESIDPPSSAWAVPLYRDAGDAAPCPLGSGPASCDGIVVADPGETRTVLVVNEWRPGALAVTREVDHGPLAPAPVSARLCVIGPSFPDTVDDGITLPDDQPGACRTLDFAAAGPFTRTVTWDALQPGNYVVVEQPLPDPAHWLVTGSGATIAVPPGETASHTLRGLRLAGALTVAKTVDPAGGDPGGWAFEVCAFPATSVSGYDSAGFPTGSPAACATLTVDAPAHAFDALDPGPYVVAERAAGATDQAHFAAEAWVGGALQSAGVVATVSVEPGSPAAVEFRNTLRPGGLVLVTRFGGDWETSTCDPPAPLSRPVVSVDALPATGEGCRLPATGATRVGANVARTVNATAPAGLALRGLRLDGECGDMAALGLASLRLVALVSDLLGLPGPALVPLDVAIPPGEACTVSLLYEPVGTLVLTKFAELPGDAARPWAFELARDGQLVVSPSLETAAGPGVTTGSVAVLDLPAGDYTIREPAGGAGCLIPTSLAFETRALAALTPPNLAALSAAPVLGSNPLAVTVPPGATVHVAFANRACSAVLAAPNLWVRVFESSTGAYVAGAPLPGYTVSLAGESGDATGFSATLPSGSDGVAPFGAVPPGRYTVCEVPRPTHAVVGSLVSGARVPGACRNGVEVLTADTLVDFFNRPLTQPTASPSPSPTATAETDFPADADATVTPSPTPTLGPSLFPPTPTAPPGAPAAQPSQPVSARPALTPSPIDTVAGDRTPGAGALATPIPPSTGTGPALPPTAPTTLLAIAGLAAIALGLAALRAGRGK